MGIFRAGVLMKHLSVFRASAVAAPLLPLMLTGVRIRARMAVLAAMFMAGCAIYSSPPTTQQIKHAMDTRCALVSHGTFRKLPNGEGAVDFQADCKPQGGTRTYRVSGTAFFTEYREWQAKHWSFARRELKDDAGPAPPATPLTYSDGPECNAALVRAAQEVTPCIEKLDPQIAARFQSYLDAAKTQSRLFGKPSNRTMALITLEEQCFQQWTQIKRQLPSTAPWQACLAGK
jgi:hypothetical protein